MKKILFIFLLFAAFFSPAATTYNGKFVGDGVGLTNVSSAHASIATNAPDGNPLMSTNQANSTYASISSSGFQPGTNVLVISPDGNDTAAALNPYKVKWKTVYDLLDSNNLATRFGAATVAKPGDWIVFTPANTPYLVPAIPLNLVNPGVNLKIPSGATVSQCDYNNTNASGRIHSTGDTTVGTASCFIEWGNSSEIVIDGIVNCLNTNSDGSYTYTFAIGVAEPSARSTAVGITNLPATNVWCHGSGTLNGISDGLYVSVKTFTNLTSFSYDGPKVITTWDTVAIFGYSTNWANMIDSAIFGPNCSFIAGVETVNKLSHAINGINFGITLNGGCYLATGTNLSPATKTSAALACQHCQVTMNNPTLAVSGSLSNVLGIYNHEVFNDGSIGESAFSIKGESVASTYTGSWLEFGGYGSTYTTVSNEITGVHISSGIVINCPTNTIDTSSIVIYSGNGVGANAINGLYQTNPATGAFTNVASTTKYLTNSVSGTGPWQIISGTAIHGYSATLIGVYTATNSTTGTPTAAYTNNVRNIRIPQTGSFSTTLNPITLAVNYTNTSYSRQKIWVSYTQTDAIGGTASMTYTNFTTTEGQLFQNNFSVTSTQKGVAFEEIAAGDVVQFSDTSTGGASITIDRSSIKQ